MKIMNEYNKYHTFYNFTYKRYQGHASSGKNELASVYKSW